MGRCVLWAVASYGPARLMGRRVLWAGVLWAGASYGPVRLMARCVLWAGKYGTYFSTAKMVTRTRLDVTCIRTLRVLLKSVAAASFQSCLWLSA